MGACHPWGGKPDAAGYGRMYAERGSGISTLAHRRVYELFWGPIPDGWTVDHTCHNGSGCTGGSTCPHRICVNPAHLEAVPFKTNIHRGEGPAGKHIRKTCCDNGHEFNEANTYVNPKGWRQCRVCRREIDKRRSARKRKHR